MIFFNFRKNNTLIMKLFKFLFVFCFIIVSCESKLTPEEAALQTCECMKLSKDTSEDGVKAFSDCNNQTKEMMAPYRGDTLWMNTWKRELMSILKDCMSE